ncbi:MAG: ATP-binding protein [Fuerstiella sp.]
MLPQIELFCVGFAAVIDTVLLLVVLERVNRPLTAIWLKWTLVAATLWHVGSFLHALLRDTMGPTANQLDCLCMIAMAAGLLLLNCGMLHASLRIQHTGAIPHPKTDNRYLCVYAPLLFFPVVAITVAQLASRDFMVATARFHVPYILWLNFSNLTAAWLFFRNRDQFIRQSPSARRFLVRFSIGIVIVTAIANAYLLTHGKSSYEPTLRLLTNLSPLVPTLIFAYYIFRRRLLPMVFERTLVYGAILLAVIYLHRLTLSRVMSRYSERFEFDFVVVEGLLIIALILAYQPLRNRFRESLLYLVGTNVAQMRDATRQLSVELSRRADDDIDQICAWFAEGLQKTLSLRYSYLWLGDVNSRAPILRFDDLATQPDFRELLSANESIQQIVSFSNHETHGWLDRSRCTNNEQLSLMRELDLIAAFRINYRKINGILALGSTSSGDRLSNEQLNTLKLLVDQFAATIHNRQLEDARKTAERRAVQQEKLSTLGLVAGSLAHELRNPLSSIRTIATLLGEDIGSNSEHAQDVELIVSEIDRLTLTTQRLLDFSRPSDTETVGVSPDKVIQRIMQILNHLARQYGVDIHQNLQLTNVLVNATDASLSEIIFNLIKNAIEAVRETDQPEVYISTDVVDLPLEADQRSPDSKGRAATITITDNGPGICPELQDNIFEAFVTGKSDGTGLGLYLVKERVRELGGTITCTSQSNGTSFQVRLPLPVAKPESP